METGTIITLTLYFLAMVGIGIYAWRKSTADASGYLLGGRDLGPGVTALSAGAADMSGWLMLGLPGAVYVSGLSAGWIAVGLIVGAWLNYILVAPRLRIQTERADDAITIPDFFEKRFEDGSRLLRVFSAVIVVIFFALYTSSGMVGGGILFESAFGADYLTGLWITAGVVMIYTVLGGFLAVSLTDVAQGLIMFAALVILPLVALGHLGGPVEAASILRGIDSSLLTVTTGVTAVGVISLLAWGLGYFGQPHVITRFMAIRHVRDIPAARRIGMSWMILCLLGSVGMGLVGRAYAQATGMTVADPETIFILLAGALFNPWVVGFLLAAILAAIMSTISSQLIVCSSSLTKDFYHVFLRRGAGEKELVLIGRASVLAVALAAIAMAYNPESTVLGLVANAWAGLGSAFGPVILASVLWRRTTRDGALAGMVTGAAVVLFWLYAPVMPGGVTLSAGSGVYEIIPGFFAALAVIVLVSLTGRPSAGAVAAFDAAEAELAAPPRK